MREFREKTGMSQSEFSRYYGIPISTIQHWEQGCRKPPEYILKLLKRVWYAEHKEAK